MNWRPGLLEVCAFGVLLVVLFMPPQDIEVRGAFDHRAVGDVPSLLAQAGRHQDRLIQEPHSGATAEAYGAVLSELGRPDMAMRVAGLASLGDEPDQWRALAAVSAAHGKRYELPEAFDWAKKAHEACLAAADEGCPAHEELRLRLYVSELETGMGVLEKGVNPRHDPDQFRKEMGKTHRSINQPKKRGE